MKYFTKEWYKACQKSGMNLLLNASKEADIYSDEYFNRLYNEKCTEYVKLEKDVFKIKNKVKNLHGDKHLRVKKFDLEKTKKNFNKIFKAQVKRLKENLPKEILLLVPDIRVLALGETSDKALKCINEFAKINKTFVESTLKEYDKYYKENVDKFLPSIKELDMHDCHVVSTCIEDKDFIINLNNSGGFTNIAKIVFKDYNIFKQEDNINEAWWLYDEIYFKENKYELQILLDKVGTGLIELNIEFSDLVFEYS